MLTMRRIWNTLKSSSFSTDIQMKEEKKTVGTAKPSIRCARHRFASSSDCPARKQ